MGISDVTVWRFPANVRIQDPTIKVNAPASILRPIGQTHLHMSFVTAKLQRLLDMMLGENETMTWDREGLGLTQNPTTLIGYARSLEQGSMVIEQMVDFLADCIGQIVLNDDGTLREIQ